MAATRAVELGFTVFGCASTGNLANSVSSHAARLGLDCYVFIPYDLELGKVLGSAIFRPHVIGVRGNYDDVNRLCTQIADKHRVGLREYQPAQLLRRGSKDGRVRSGRAAWVALSAPPRVARGRRHAAAAHLSGFRELREMGLVEGSCRGSTPRRRPAARRSCARCRKAWSSRSRSSRRPSPSRSRSAIRPMASRSCRTVNATGGSGVSSSDEEILQAMELLAETEGIFTEPAGGATLAGTVQLVKSGASRRTSRWSSVSPVTDIRRRRKRSPRESRRAWRSAARWRISKRTCRSAGEQAPALPHA